ncbi:hypothetical protein P154DRAFT_572173 [Amniculicola lignicola CBS 123094]|uniref:Uncharacterized protein n=1 Tax=Amniculicola lignicola CBS 123094 TaxID=1392246 RepID=A0A6A5WRM2_9PLEO|nr:hypothetical protein P154DRAFT_572173 [Amniculicola lignicola CBS 123094]
MPAHIVNLHQGHRQTSRCTQSSTQHAPRPRRPLALALRRPPDSRGARPIGRPVASSRRAPVGGDMSDMSDMRYTPRTESPGAACGRGGAQAHESPGPICFPTNPPDPGPSRWISQKAAA